MNYFHLYYDDKSIKNITPILDLIRMVKSEEELKIAKSAGKVAEAMMHAGKDVIAHNVPEYEVALATSSGRYKKSC